MLSANYRIDTLLRVYRHLNAKCTCKMPKMETAIHEPIVGNF